MRWTKRYILSSRGKFGISLAALVCAVTGWPIPSLTFFAPLLASLFYRRSLDQVLWVAAGCGLILDLYSSQPRLGLYALNYCATCALLYPYRHLLFEDRISSLPLMTGLFSVASSLVSLPLFSVLGVGTSLSWSWGFLHLFQRPLIDMAFVLFTCSLPQLLVESGAEKAKEQRTADRPQ